MTPFPLPLADVFGPGGAYVVYLMIGFGFGFVLEMAGFGNSKRLAAQFYFKDLTVLKVMFGAIVVAMILIFLTSGLGLLDFNKVWVNPTYLWPGIVGGLIMGVGFIIGGFCPGTSLVAAATFKIDGIFFALGALFGIFLFGESVGLFSDFFNSSYYGRVTIPEWLGVDTGMVVLVIALMALVVFAGSEQIERLIGKRSLKDRAFAPRWRYGAAGVTATLALAVMLVGQPTTADRWARMASEKEALLAERAVQIHPGELLTMLHNNRLRVAMLDVRSETDYNRFHILGARHTPPEGLVALAAALRLEPENTVFVVMSNAETAATEAWKVLTAESVPNLYILEGGINGWLETFGDDGFSARYSAPPTASPAEERLHYTFTAALGDRYPLANPNPEAFELDFVTKVKLATKGGPKTGGCG